MKKVDLVLIVGFSIIVGLFTFVGYNRIIEAANSISRGITSNVKVAEPPLVIDLCKAEGLAYTTPVVGENASNNWGQ